jgi:hypothetical protein
VDLDLHDKGVFICLAEQSFFIHKNYVLFDAVIVVVGTHCSLPIHSVIVVLEIEQECARVRLRLGDNS